MKMRCLRFSITNKKAYPKIRFTGVDKYLVLVYHKDADKVQPYRRLAPK